MVIEILKALLAGILAAVPVGPVLLLIIRNTTCNGNKAGFLCALGCIILDTSLAALSVFALSFINGFIKENENLLMIIGAILLLGIGISTLFQKVPSEDDKALGKPNFFNCSVKTFLTGISNPAAFAVMFGIMASLKLGADQVIAPIWTIILGVALGELAYWSLIIFVILQRFKLSYKVKRIINLVAGSGIIIFGVILLIRCILG